MVVLQTNQTIWQLSPLNEVRSYPNVRVLVDNLYSDCLLTTGYIDISQNYVIYNKDYII